MPLGPLAVHTAACLRPCPCALPKRARAQHPASRACARASGHAHAQHLGLRLARAFSACARTLPTTAGLLPLLATAGKQGIERTCDWGGV